ncbi:MAG: hypothetical protein FJY80_00750 [Candidatus Aminicenantes bacterium]|nr:hypothetical protein [Candidatus Aminicenantes bacterium]
MMPFGYRLLPAVLALTLSAAPRPALPPPSWDVQMAVSVKGEYGLEGHAFRADGRFLLKALWTGTLLVDDEDYLLVHGETKIVDWTAEEKANLPDRILLLTTGDFPERPELKVNYVLRLKDGLHVDFVVRGFDVPLSIPAEGFYLTFPASAENGENPGGLKYNLFLASGSNAVILDEDKIRRGPSKAAFGWTWKRRSWVQRQDQTILETSSHAVEVKVSLTPRPD